jgi:SH3-like domain-containing protein
MKLPVVLTFVLLCSCSPAPEPILDHATVVARNASLRMKNSSTSRTLKVLDSGDKVEVLERQDNWYRVRFSDEVEGWMEETTVVTNATRNRVTDLVTASEHQTAQNTAVMREEANFRIEPGRNTAIIRKLDQGTKVEVIDRVTTLRPGTDSAYDVWVKVRPSPTEVGWVFAGLLDFDMPVDVSPYSEGYTYTAVKTLNRVQDSLGGQVSWYIVGEHRNGMDPRLDFNGVRIFTWNQTRHRYETAFRARNLRGVYPLEVGQNADGPTFRIYELSEDGSNKIARDFVMYGVVVREKKAS